MSLPHIVLGVLERPASGYDIKRQFEESLGFFWSAALAQIYPTLKKLERDGLVRSWREPSDKGPDRTVYQQTQKGRDAFQAWLEIGPELNTERRAYLAKAFFLSQARSPTEPRSFYEALLDDFKSKAEQLEALEAIWRRDFGEAYPDALKDQDFFEHLTFDLGKRIFRTYVEWARDCLKRIDERDKA